MKKVLIFIAIAGVFLAARQNHVIWFGLIGLGILFGLPYIISYVMKNLPAFSGMTQKGKDVKNFLRQTNPNVETILGELKYLLVTTDEMYTQWQINKKEFGGLAIWKIGQQMKFSTQMDTNVRDEWIPRIEYLDEIHTSFSNDLRLTNAFLELKQADRYIRQCTSVSRLNATQLSVMKSGLDIAMGSAAVMAIGAVAIGAAVSYGGRDIGTFGTIRVT